MFSFAASDMATRRITADNVKDVTLKSLLKKVEKFLKIMTEFQRNLYQQDKTPDYNDQRNKDRIGKIIMCLRLLSNKMKDHRSACAVKGYITTSSCIISGLDAMRKESDLMAIFFATECPASNNATASSVKSKPNPQQDRPRSSSNHSADSNNKATECQACAILKKDNEMKRSTITQLEKKVKDSERMTKKSTSKMPQHRK